MSQPAPVARGTCGLSFLASAEGSYHHNSSSMGMLQSRHRDDIALAVCRDDLDRSNNAFPLLQVSKLVSRNRSCARSSGKVRLPTDTRLDRSGPTPAIDFRMPGAFPCDDMKLRASCRPGVSVAPSAVWQLARCRRIVSLTSRRFARGSASSYRCHASSRRVPTPALTTGVVPHEGVFSGCCCARRSGLASTPCSSRWCQAVNRERTRVRTGVRQ